MQCKLNEQRPTSAREAEGARPRVCSYRVYTAVLLLIMMCGSNRLVCNLCCHTHGGSWVGYTVSR